MEQERKREFHQEGGVRAHGLLRAPNTQPLEPIFPKRIYLSFFVSKTKIMMIGFTSDNVPEWLTGQPAKLMPFGRQGSNPCVVVFCGKKIDDGIRTHNLQIRSLTRYPLRHTDNLDVRIFQTTCTGHGGLVNLRSKCEPKSTEIGPSPPPGGHGYSKLISASRGPSPPPGGHGYLPPPPSPSLALSDKPLETPSPRKTDGSATPRRLQSVTPTPPTPSVQ
jgi:hypothetical protein